MAPVIVEVNGKYLSFSQNGKIFLSLEFHKCLFYRVGISMEHIWILVYFISLAVGLLAVFYSFQHYKTHGYPFLRHIVNYTIVFNLVILLYLVTKYASVNFPGPVTQDRGSSFYTIMFIVALLGELGLIYTFIRVRFALLEKNVPRKVHILFATGLVLVGMSCAVGVTIYILSGSNCWIVTTYFVVVSAGMVVLTLIPLQLIFRPKAGRKDERRTAVRAFGILYLTGFLAFFGTAVLPDAYQLIPGSAAIIYLNVIPIIWLKRYFLRYYVQMSSEQSLKLLERLDRDFQISNREREIMELILQGKSNKEIEELLFISYNTVKNHIYNIYQKMGVNSRSQMIHAVLQQAQKKREIG
jgi:DNA-binding CsgD family transcriptional regulator